MAMAMIAALSLTSCEDGKSYADLLDDEEKAVNWYLAQYKVETIVPEDSNFEVGENAPFYRLKNDGSVYMRVIRKGDMENRPQEGDRVFMRFTRYDIQNIYKGYDTSGVGNDTDLSLNPDGMSLVYGNNVLPSTVQYGEGLQLPLDYLGYNCEVDLIVKSTQGMTAEMSNCVPYVYKSLKYFKAEY